MGLPFVASGLDGKPGKAGTYGRVARSRAIPHDTRRIEFRKMAGAEQRNSDRREGSEAERKGPRTSCQGQGSIDLAQSTAPYGGGEVRGIKGELQESRPCR